MLKENEFSFSIFPSFGYLFIKNKNYFNRILWFIPGAENTKSNFLKTYWFYSGVYRVVIRLLNKELKITRMSNFYLYIRHIFFLFWTDAGKLETFSYNFWAWIGSWTRDLHLTKMALCQLSYPGWDNIWHLIYEIWLANLKVKGQRLIVAQSAWKCAGSRIRTYVAITAPVLQTGAFDRSAIPAEKLLIFK